MAMGTPTRAKMPSLFIIALEMIKIEFNEPNIKTCDCCGQEIVSLTRYVYQDDYAFAVYYIQFTKEHSPKVAYGLVGIGLWGEDAEPKDRLAFPFKIWVTNSHYQVGLIDAEESPWSHVTFLGRILNRDEALKHEWVRDVFHITDHIAVEDKFITDYFTNDVE